MTIIDIKLSITDNLIYVIGIGDDNKIYSWDKTVAEWKLFHEPVEEK